MWNEIKNETDIENLMKKYYFFHDSCIVSVNYRSGAYVDDNGGMANGELLEHSVEIVLHSQWEKPIELRFILFLNQTVDKVYSLIVAVHSTAAAALPQQESRSILIPVKIFDFDSRPMGR